MIKIAPSLLAADFANLEKEISQVKDGGADYLHVDVMDGHFVPNISIGLPVVESLRKVTDMVLDVHLMISSPSIYAERFCDAGADIVNFHVEAEEADQIPKILEAIKAKGKRCGLTLKPKTPVSAIKPYIELLDLVLVMTVEPGFGGQSFMEDQLSKIEEVSDIISQKNLSCELEVDGGIDPITAPLVKSAGANVLVAGSAVFGKIDRTSAIQTILNV